MSIEIPFELSAVVIAPIAPSSSVLITIVSKPLLCAVARSVVTVGIVTLCANQEQSSGVHIRGADNIPSDCTQQRFRHDCDQDRWGRSGWCNNNCTQPEKNFNRHLDGCMFMREIQNSTHQMRRSLVITTGSEFSYDRTRLMVWIQRQSLDSDHQTCSIVREFAAGCDD